MALRTAHILIAPLVLLLASPPAKTQPEASRAATLHVGFGPSSFTGVNMTDAKAAFKVFTRSVGQKRGYDLNVIVHTFDSEEDFVSAVTNRTLHLVIMTAWTYLSHGLETYLEPYFVPTDFGAGPREYLLLVREDSAIRGVADLRGKEVRLLENSNCEMSEQWFQTLLFEHSLGMAGGFLGNVQVEVKPTGAILPVFFGKADACVVSRPAFDTMRELNPQLGQRLRSLAASAPLVDSITFLAYEPWDSPQQRIDMIESLEELHESPEGKQILTLFKVDRLARYQASFLEGTRVLREKHDCLRSQLGSELRVIATGETTP